MNERPNRLNSERPPEAVRSGRVKLLALMAIALVPIFIACITYFQFPALAPMGRTNQGELVWPVVQGNGIALQLEALETWALIQPVDANCRDDCRQMLYLSRQVVAGLGKDASRVTRVLLSRNSLSEEFGRHIAREHRDALIVQSGTDILNGIIGLRPVLFLMDPNGNIMMYYPMDKAGKPMLRDLKHLLKISNIG